MDAVMFGIRVYSPSLVLTSSHAVGELVVGETRRHFSLDLRFWRVVDYQRQWQAGLARLLHGASTSALMTSFRGEDGASHLLWALWRESGFVYVQPHCIAAADLDGRFDPVEPYPHVGARVPATEQSLPMSEWRVELEQLFANAMRIRWPFGQ
jgi:hypothetical protein